VHDKAKCTTGERESLVASCTRDTREPRYNAPVTAAPDVLIVGAGASGAAVAWSLAEAGFKVLCLEQGGWIRPRDMPHRHLDWELHRLTDFNADPNVRRRPEDYPVNDAASAFSPLMFNAVGGSTIHWSAHFPRYHPSDFRVKSLDGVGDDWPLDYAALEPFYDLNDRMNGVAGVNGDPSQPPRSPRQTPPIPVGALGATMARGFERLGWHWWPSDGAFNSAPYPEGGPTRQPCNHCGPCDLGCPIGARVSVDLTYWPRAEALGAELRTWCRVREITVDAAGRASGVLYYDRDGALHAQPAGVVVVACNGVGTPRLLLNSRSRLFPDGLANRSGLVGKRLMFHGYGTAWGVFDQPLDSYRGPSSNMVMSHEFYETDPSRGFARGFQLQVTRQGNPLGAALAHAHLLGPDQRLPWGADHHASFQERFNHTLVVSMNGEDLPETVNEVALDPDLTDADGVPAPLIRYRLSEGSRRMIDFAMARAEEVLRAAGARQVYRPETLPTAGFHLMGTCRMGDRPYGSVVDRWGRAHDVPNLFLVDGSVFVTSAGVNPTPTIQALALRTADYIKREARSIP
jgi:choline dehydrogenase-like flavoprotein